MLSIPELQLATAQEGAHRPRNSDCSHEAVRGEFKNAEEISDSPCTRGRAVVARALHGAAVACFPLAQNSIGQAGRRSAGVPARWKEE